MWNFESRSSHGISCINNTVLLFALKTTSVQPKTLLYNSFSKKEQKVGESFQKLFILSRDGPIKWMKQGRDEKTQEHHLLRNDSSLLSVLEAGMREGKKTTIHLMPSICQCVVVSLRFLIYAWRLGKRLLSFRSRWCSWGFSFLSFLSFLYTKGKTQSLKMEEFDN